MTMPEKPCNNSIKADSNKLFELERPIVGTLNTYTPSSVSIAVKSWIFHSMEDKKIPL